MTTTPKFGIPLISSQQAQPEVTHNQMVLLVQALLGGAIAQQNAPPGSPADGDAYVVGTAGTGAWGGHNNAVAIFFGGWNFIPGVDSDGITIDMGADQKGMTISIAGTPSVWTGTAWAASGGGGAGNPPTVVQHGSENSGSGSITLGAAPTNGNLLVAMFFNPSSDAVGSGWTKLIENSSGTDYGVIATKIAGPSESATQTPAPAVGAGCTVLWEVAGAASVFTTSVQTEQSGQSGASGPLPMPQNMLFLGAVSLVAGSNNIDQTVNVTVDENRNTGSGRQISAGHGDAAGAAVAQILATFTGSGGPGNKSFGMLITS